MGKGLGREFLDFINRGNVVDLAVAVIIGAAVGEEITGTVILALALILGGVVLIQTGKRKTTPAPSRNPAEE